MHREGRFTETVTRLTASNGDEWWVYQFPAGEWVRAASRIMHDTRDRKIPVEAARGLLELLEEAIGNAD
jgi:hypothetical protein